LLQAAEIMANKMMKARNKERYIDIRLSINEGIPGITGGTRHLVHLICVTSEYSMTVERFVKAAEARNHLAGTYFPEVLLCLACGKANMETGKLIIIGLREKILLSFLRIVSFSLAT
jgi:hypothetical protein